MFVISISIRFILQKKKWRNILVLSLSEDTDVYELEEGEWIPEDDFDADQSNEDSLDDGGDIFLQFISFFSFSFSFFWVMWLDMEATGFAREEEENWRSQYGQVIRSSEEDEEGKIDIPAVELWDWSTVKGTRKNGKGEITKLVGRLMRKSAKLHPSMPCGGVRLKTAPICEVRLDLVRVTTGLHFPLFTLVLCWFDLLSLNLDICLGYTFFFF